MKHYYFVSFHSTHGSGGWSKGNAEIDINAKISKINQIRALEKGIREANCYKEIVIENFILLRRSRA